MKATQDSAHWLLLAVAGGVITLAASAPAGKPVKPPAPPPSPAYVAVALGGLRASDGVITTFGSDINDAGQVVGGTCLPGYDSGHYGQPFLINPRDVNGDGKLEWFVDGVQNATGVAGADGQNDLIIGLGNLPGGSSGAATAVNSQGWVVGGSGSGGFVVVPCDNAWYLDVDPQDGVNDLMVALVNTQGAGDCSPQDINSVGQIVGSYKFVGVEGAVETRGFLLTPVADVSGGVQWFQNNGAGGNALMKDLGGFIPAGINDSGHMVGRTGGYAMFLHADGTLIDLGTAGTESLAVAINSRGQIGLRVHLSSVALQDWRARLLTPLDLDKDGSPDTWYQDSNGDGVNDLVRDLGTVDRLSSSGVAQHGLNDMGAVAAVAWTYRSASYKRAPFLWEDGVSQSLKTLTGGTIEFWDVSAMNDAREIVCESTVELVPGSGRACILLPTR